MSTVIRPTRWPETLRSAATPERPVQRWLPAATRAGAAAAVALVLVLLAQWISWPQDLQAWQGALGNVPARYLMLAAFIGGASLAWQRAHDALERSAAPLHWRAAALAAVTLCLSLASLTLALALLLPEIA